MLLHIGYLFMYAVGHDATTGKICARLSCVFSRPVCTVLSILQLLNLHNVSLVLTFPGQLSAIRDKSAQQDTVIEKLSKGDEKLKAELSESRKGATHAESSMEDKERMTTEMEIRIEEFKERLFSQSQIIFELEESKKAHSLTIAALQAELLGLTAKAGEFSDIEETMKRDSEDMKLRLEMQSEILENQKEEITKLVVRSYLDLDHEPYGLMG